MISVAITRPAFMFLEMRRGFTLVELSIVLVIIGLLIGGILVAQSMVTTTKIQSTVRDVQQFDIAVTNFQTQYDGLPGDSTQLGAMTTAILMMVAIGFLIRERSRNSGLI